MNDEEFIKASDALQRLSEHTGDPVAAKGALAEYLRDDLLTARAKAVWTTTDLNLSAAWRSSASADDLERNIVVPVRYWRTDIRALEDRARWRWPISQFFYTTRLKPLKRRMLRGVTFSVSDLAKRQPGCFAAPNKKGPGRHPDIVARDTVWMEIARLSQAGPFDAEAFKSVAALSEALERELILPSGKLRVGEKQIREVASMVHKVLLPRV